MAHKYYKHYKGGVYIFIAEGIDTESGEPVVLYKNLQGEHFSRPLDQFYGTVKIESGEIVPRFSLMSREQIKAETIMYFNPPPRS